MKSKLFAVIISVFIINNITAQSSQLGANTNTEIVGLKSLKKGLNFLVMGDWGRHGIPVQKAVAAQMDNAMVQQDADFIISTGDNFYPKGVASISDPSFKTSFEDVYFQHSLFNDWYLVLGNHDYKTNPDAEVAYSNISARWHMPARYYFFSKKMDDGGTIDFFCIDSSPFQLDYYDSNEYADKVKNTDTAAQRAWLTQALKNSKANWKIVVGHHPLYSAGKRKGKTADMEKSFADLFDTFGVDAYFCGHEHHLEHDIIAGRKFQHFISGSGSETTPTTSAPYSVFAASEAGFFTASATTKEILIQFINEKGKIIHSSSINK